MAQEIIFGFQEQWRTFQVRNEKFLSRFPNLKAAFDLAFVRSIDTSEPIDRVVFILGRLCTEEFFEITLLAANGYGIAALKLLRDLYERAITMAYLSEHPDEVDLFLNHHVVAQHKLLDPIQRTFGNDAIPLETVEQQEELYQRVKANYLVTDCKHCGTKKANHTWSKLDLVAMAYKTALGPLIVPAYYLPLSHVHTTVQSLLTRVEETPNGGMGFNPDPQPKEADQALQVAHNVMLVVLGIQSEFFKLDKLSEALKTCVQDFKEMWSPS
jgi:Family of unknown function (DUF5677)